MTAQTDFASKPVFLREITVSQAVECTAGFGELGFSLLRGNAQIFMRGLCADWRTGQWKNYSLSNGGFFMAPVPEDETQDFQLHNVTNGFTRKVEPLLTGVIVFLHAYSELSVHRTFGSAVWPRQRDFLQEYVRSLPAKERSIVFGAVD